MSQKKLFEKSVRTVKNKSVREGSLTTLSDKDLFALLQKNHRRSRNRLAPFACTKPVKSIYVRIELPIYQQTIVCIKDALHCRE